MKSIWSGSISFGLVNIPVKLYSAHAAGEDIDFDMLHKKDLSPIRYARFCQKENDEVPYTEIVKGVDTGDGNYVVVDQSDFEKALPKRTKSIEIINFCDLSDVDPIYYEKPYYLESDKADKPYLLLFKALEETKKVGIAKYVLRSKDHLVMLRPYKGILLLNQLRFDEEIADLSRLRYPITQNITEREIALAKKLVQELSTKFVPSDYKNTFVAEMKEIIKAKIEGKEIQKVEETPIPTEVENLVDILSKSLSKK